MKKLLLVIITFLLCFTLVNAEDSSFLVKDVKVVKSSDGVVLNDKSNVNAIFNDLNQQIKYEATIENKSDKKLYLNFIEVENSSEKFMEYKLDTKSENKVLEPNSSSKINFYVNTLEIEGAGRNLIDDVKINFMISDKIFNPNTFSNIIELIVLLVILGFVTYFFKRNKKVKTMILIIGISIIGIEYVYANDYIKVLLPGNIQYTSQNNIIASGTTLNGKQADYTKSKEVWAYYDKVKNVEVKSLINEPKKYYKKFDLTENKTGRVMAYLVENNDKDTPYDLKIMSKGVVIANKDSSFMFSFPNTEKVEGLTNIDFNNTESMQGMFIGNEKLKKVEVDAIELINTVDTSYMFYDCEKIEHGKSDFNLENVTNSTLMFIPYLYNEVRDGAITDINVNFNEPSSKENGEGKMIEHSTINDKNPIYYYRGNVSDNNVIFGKFCWQMIRTTETGGVKLIYNGRSDSNGYCTATGDNTAIGKQKFNADYDSPYNGGYMHADEYNISYNANYEQKNILQNYSTTGNSNYLYSKNVIYKDGKYILENPKSEIWQDNYEKLKNYYTCRNSSDTCEKVEYLVDVTNTYQYTISLTNGEQLEDKYIYVSKKIKKNKDNTYSLVEPEKVTYETWYTENRKIEYMLKRYKAYYHCENYSDTTCKNMYSFGTTGPIAFYHEKIKEYVFGNDVKYENGKYKLIDTYSGIHGWPMAREIVLDKYHYTCLSNSDECEKVKYIYQYNDDHFMFLILSNGDTIETAKEKMRRNIKNSQIKSYIDNWYLNNLITYDSQIEDTVYCSEREFTEGPLKNKESGDLINYHPIFAAKTRLPLKPTLDCKNELDRFTVNENVGNGDLTYPIALITADEAAYAGITNTTSSNKNYLNNGSNYWTMTPYHFSMDHCSNYKIGQTQDKVYMYYGDILWDGGVRPVISLKNKIKYTSGTGTKENPYVIEGIEQ